MPACICRFPIRNAWFPLFHGYLPLWNHYVEPAKSLCLRASEQTYLPAVPWFRQIQKRSNSDRPPTKDKCYFINTIFTWNNGTIPYVPCSYCVFCVPRHVEPNGTSGTNKHKEMAVAPNFWGNWYLIILYECKCLLSPVVSVWTD